MEKTPPTGLDKAFKIGLVLKALDGLLEVIGGIILLFFSADRLNRLATNLTQHELAADPHDVISNYIVKLAHSLSDSGLLFGAIYLLSHGLVKIFLVVEVWRHRLWAYLALIGFLIIFMGFQLYQLLYDHSLGLLALTLFDGAIAALTTFEYRKAKSRGY